MRTGLFVLILVLLLGGCSILPKSPQVALYTPTMRFSLQVDTAPVTVDWSLALSRATASGPLAGVRMLVHPVPNQIEVYPEAEWSEPAPTLVGNSLLHAFETDGRIHALQRSNAGLSRDFELATELRAFQLELAEGPVAVVRIKVNLVRQPEGRLVDTRLFEAVVPTSGQSVDAAVNGLSEGLQRLLSEIVHWTVMQAESDWQHGQAASASSSPIPPYQLASLCSVDADHCALWRAAAKF